MVIFPFASAEISEGGLQDSSFLRISGLWQEIQLIRKIPEIIRKAHFFRLIKVPPSPQDSRNILDFLKMG